MLKSVLVTGTHRSSLRGVVSRHLGEYFEGETQGIVFVGDADGVDHEAVEWCLAHGFTPFVAHALWAHFRRRGRLKFAGHYRNQQLVEVAKTYGCTTCFAVPDAESRGTWDCAKRAKLAGLEVWICTASTRVRF